MHLPRKNPDADPSPLSSWVSLPLPPPLLLGPFSLCLSITHCTSVMWPPNGAGITTPGSQMQRGRVPPTSPHTDHPEYLRPAVFRTDVLKSAPSNQPRVSVVGQSLGPLWGLLRGLESCKHHGSRTEHPSAYTSTTNRGSERNKGLRGTSPGATTCPMIHREEADLT